MADGSLPKHGANHPGKGEYLADDATEISGIINSDKAKKVDLQMVAGTVTNISAEEVHTTVTRQELRGVRNVNSQIICDMNTADKEKTEILESLGVDQHTDGLKLDKKYNTENVGEHQKDYVEKDVTAWTLKSGLNRDGSTLEAECNHHIELTLVRVGEPVDKPGSAITSDSTSDVNNNINLEEMETETDIDGLPPGVAENTRDPKIANGIVTESAHSAKDKDKYLGVTKREGLKDAVVTLDVVEHQVEIHTAENKISESSGGSEGVVEDCKLEHSNEKQIKTMEVNKGDDTGM